MKHFGFGVAYGNDPNISYGCYHKAEPVQQMCDCLNENVEEASEAQYRPVELFFNEAAPTPPAQEDEPVAEIVPFGCEVAVEFKGGIGNYPIGTKLYLRPADDKLRKAAEEIMGEYLAGIISADAAMTELRAALEEQ